MNVYYRALWEIRYKFDAHNLKADFPIKNNIRSNLHMTLCR